MSSLTLMRHGQTGAFRGDPSLTPLGEAQARSLAAFLLKQGAGFDEVQSGTLARQVQTEQLVAACYREAGAPWPEAVRDPGWNEYDASRIVEGPAVAFGDEGYRSFQVTFEAAMSRWLNGDSPAGDAEPFAIFRNRVWGAVSRLMAGPSGRRVAVFTSGGPIGFTVNAALRGPDTSFLELNWRVRNCSLTEFVFSQSRLTLDLFNQVTHLAEPELRTFR